MTMPKIAHFIIVATIIPLFTTCITPFTPEGLHTQGGTLVIEGDIILNGTTIVFLSETEPLDSTSPTIYITEAQIFVKSDQEEVYPGVLVMEEDAPPHFVIDTQTLPFDRKYSLCVTLEDGTQFVSDPLSPMNTPEIDAIDFLVKEEGVDVMVSAHGDQHASAYYKWNYSEDWEIASRYPTNLYCSPTYILSTYPTPYPILYCWKSSKSSAILIAKTDHLQSNTVYHKINSIHCTSDKISYLYSIEVEQISISREAYIYWENLLRNTEEVGGIFAPQPSEMIGNIRTVQNIDDKNIENKDVRVIGYISVGTAVTKRVYVSDQDLGVYRQPFVCYAFDPSRYPPDRVPHPFDLGYLPVGNAVGLNVEWIYRDCVDCTLRGGKDKPSFWPNDHE